MAKDISRPVGPVEVKPGPQGIVSFYQGQALVHEVTGARVLVLSAEKGGQRAVLFPLDEADRKPFEANASWAVGWDDAQMDGPRFVELYKAREQKPLWASYVPTFTAACELYKYYAGQDGEPHSLVIHCQHNEEWQFLEAMGYFRGN